MAYPSGPAIFAPHSELRGPSKVNHATSGCLTCVRPDGTVTVLRRDLVFANGVVLAPDESFLLVAETIGYRILKFWLKGPRAGQWVEFVTGTPGFPDNISLSESGLVWVSLPAPRVPALDFLLPRHPDSAAVGAPGSATVATRGRGHCLGSGLRPRRHAGPRSRLSFIAAVAESGGTVWLASAHHDVFGRIDLSQYRERFPIRNRSLEVAKLATRFASAKPATSVVGSWERFFGEQEPAGCGISAFGKWPGVQARIKLTATGSLDEATNQEQDSVG